MNLRRVPVYEIDTQGTVTQEGTFYISHFTTCPNARQHSRKMGGEEGGQQQDHPRSAGGTMVMPFGKHKGVPLNRVPSGYLEWCLDKMERLSPALRAEMERIVAGKEQSKERKENASGPDGSATSPKPRQEPEQPRTGEPSSRCPF